MQENKQEIHKYYNHDLKKKQKRKWEAVESRDYNASYGSKQHDTINHSSKQNAQRDRD